MAPKNLDEILKILRAEYRDAECSLYFESPFQLLVATILSAQCTDERVNKVTPNLFDKFPNAGALAEAPIDKIEDLVRSTGFYKNKAKNLKAAAEKIIGQFDGKVPERIEDLLQLPGVGRKTANVVLGNCFSKPAGIVVDTHVSRLSQRLGLTTKKDPESIERDLNTMIPKKYWVTFPHWLIQHGRRICGARKPLCRDCPLYDLCPKRGVSKKFY